MLSIAWPIKLIVAVLLALGTPLAILSWLLLALIFDPTFYLETQRPQQADLYSGYSWDQISRVDDGIALYFSDNERSLPQALTQAGAASDTFNEREIKHMGDVRGIINLFVTLRAVTTAVILVGGGALGPVWRMDDVVSSGGRRIVGGIAHYHRYGYRCRAGLQLAVHPVSSAIVHQRLLAA